LRADNHTAAGDGKRIGDAALAALVAFPDAPPRCIDFSAVADRGLQPAFPSVTLAGLAAALRHVHARSTEQGAAAVVLWQRAAGDAIMDHFRAAGGSQFFRIATNAAAEGNGDGALVCLAVLAGHPWLTSQVLKALMALYAGARRRQFGDGTLHPLAVHTITAALQAHAATPRVVRHCAKCLHALSWTHGEAAEARGAMRAAGSMPLLVAALQQHGGADAPLAAICARALGSAVFHDTESKAAAVECGALEAVLAALAAHPVDEEVAEHGIWALANMSCESEARQARALRAGAAEAAVAVLGRFVGARHSQRVYLCAGLLRVAGTAAGDARARLLAAGTVEALVAVVRAHARDGRVQSEAVLALQQLCSDEANGGGACARASAAGAVAALTDVAGHFAEDVALTELTARTLALLGA
jgi:hypothetical protein